MSKITDRVSTGVMADQEFVPGPEQGDFSADCGMPISKSKAIWQCLVFLRREAVDADLASLASLIGTAADHAATLTHQHDGLDS